MLEKPSTDFQPKLEAYLERVLGADMSLAQPPKGSYHLPYFLRDRYSILIGSVIGRECLFMITKDEHDHALSVAKHIKQIQNAFPEQLVIAVFKSLNARNRTAFITHHINFIVPGTQMFIPDLAIDLRERFSKENDQPHSFLSPSAQQIIIAAILGRLSNDQPSRLAKILNTTAMSMGRAFEELGSHGFAEIIPHGKQKHIVFDVHGRELWDRSHSFLRTPVRKRRMIGSIPSNFPGLVAGESALARFTSLNPPRIEVLAVSAAQWKTLVNIFKIDVDSYVADKECSLETWSYDPSSLSSSEVVDPISLYLSLRENEDERVQMAVETLLERSLHERH